MITLLSIVIGVLAGILFYLVVGWLVDSGKEEE